MASSSGGWIEPLASSSGSSRGGWIEPVASSSGGAGIEPLASSPSGGGVKIDSSDDSDCEVVLPVPKQFGRQGRLELEKVLNESILIKKHGLSPQIPDVVNKKFPNSNFVGIGIGGKMYVKKGKISNKGGGDEP